MKNLNKNQKCTINESHSCGNCWGHQEYDYAIKEFSKKIDKNKYHSFIREFVNKYLP